MVLANPDREMVSCNPATKRIFGYEIDDIRGRKTSILYKSAEAFEEMGRQLYNRRTEGIYVPYIVEYKRAGGDVFFGETVGSPLRNMTGEVLGYIGVIRDITERQRAEQEILKLNESLEQRVKERTAELTTVQHELLRKERLAALGELMGTVAHALRNPLGAVGASVHVLRRKCTGQDAAVEKALAIAGRDINRCDNIITELLDFTRATGLQPVATNLEDWLSALLAEQQLPAGVTLRHDFETSDVVACFDPERMRRAVISVVANACQAITSGCDDNGSDVEGQLIVATRATTERIEIDITDSGPGIPRDSLAKVLEPLYSTRPFGTGLGLPTVHRIMEEHNGGLEIDSEEGQGTRVTLWFQHHQDTSEPPKV